MRTRLMLLFLVSLPFACASAFAQSQPNWGRDYVYGPADRLALTIERDTYAPPAPPNLTGSWTDNGDGTCTEHLAWTAPTDIGSGVVSYSVYRNSLLLGSTSSLFYDDHASPLNPTTYSYTVKAKDNAGNFGPTSAVSVTAYSCAPPPPPPCNPPMICDRPQPEPPSAAWQMPSLLLPPSRKELFLARLRGLMRSGRLSLLSPRTGAQGGAL